MSASKKYLIRFSDNPIAGVSNAWQQLKCEYDDIFTEKNKQFKESLIVIVYSQLAEKGRARATARELLPIAQKVKLVFSEHPRTLTDQELADAPCVRAGMETMDIDEFSSIMGVDSLPTIHPAQDYVNGVFYYGTTIQGKDRIIASDGRFFSVAAAHQNGINLLYSEVSITGLRAEVIGEFVDGATGSAADVVFGKIRNFILRHIFTPQQEIYDLLTIWIMGTYIFRGFRYFPYLHLNAEKGSGKTLLMELMAPISFNGMLLSQPAASTVIKLIHQSSATMFIDEAEALGQRASSAPSQIKQILKTGFARSGIYYIGDKMYRTFSPKCFAGINELDDVLADRAVTIKMVRKTIKERKEQYRETADVLNEQQEIRDQLYLFGLCHGPKIIADYDAKKPFYDKLVHLSNRAYDVWVPLYRIASAFTDTELQGNVFEALDKLSQQDSRRRISRDTEENETGVLIQGLSEIIATLAPLVENDGIKYYDPDILYTTMVKEEKIPKTTSKKGFSRLIKRILEIESVPRAFGLSTKRMYAFDVAKFEDYKTRYADTVEKTV